jgi:SAM-dependent methyltransferase
MKMARLLHNVLDTVGLPIRALFVRERSTWLFTSLRDERMFQVLRFAAGRVLDLGCGPGNIFIRRFYSGNGVGADVFPYEGIDVLVESTNLPFRDGSFDTATRIAVGGHIPKAIRQRTFQEIERVLRQGGVRDDRRRESQADYSSPHAILPRPLSPGEKCRYSEGDGGG